MKYAVLHVYTYKMLKQLSPPFQSSSHSPQIASLLPGRRTCYLSVCPRLSHVLSTRMGLDLQNTAVVCEYLLFYEERKKLFTTTDPCCHARCVSSRSLQDWHPFQLGSHPGCSSGKLLLFEGDVSHFYSDHTG